MGLFATAPFVPGELILEYYGSVIDAKYSNDPPFTLEDKMVQIDEEYSVVSRGPSSRVNDIVKWEPTLPQSSLFGMFKKRRSFPIHANLHHNARLQSLASHKAFIVATRHIGVG